MLDFIKINRFQFLGIAACVGALIALNAAILHETQNAFNLVTFVLFA